MNTIKRNDRVYCSEHGNNKDVGCSTGNNAFFSNQRATRIDAECHVMIKNMTPEPKTDEVEGIVEEFNNLFMELDGTINGIEPENDVSVYDWLRTTLQTQADKAKRERERLLQSIWDAFKDQSELGVNHLRVELEAHGININD